MRLSGDLGEHAASLVSATGRSFEMEKYMRRVNPDMNIPAERILELNPDHAVVGVMQIAMVQEPEKAKDYAQLLYGQAQLMAELPLEDPAAYAKLVCKLMK